MLLVFDEDKSSLKDVMERVHAIGSLKSQGLIGLHNFTGADPWLGWQIGGYLKKTRVGAYMKLDKSDPVVTCFRQRSVTALFELIW